MALEKPLNQKMQDVFDIYNQALKIMNESKSLKKMRFLKSMQKKTLKLLKQGKWSLGLGVAVNKFSAAVDDALRESLNSGLIEPTKEKSAAEKAETKLKSTKEELVNTEETFLKDMVGLNKMLQALKELPSKYPGKNATGFIDYIKSVEASIMKIIESSNAFIEEFRKNPFSEKTKNTFEDYTRSFIPWPNFSATYMLKTGIFAQEIKKIAEDSKSTFSLFDVISRPTQRVLKYPLLFREMQDHQRKIDGLDSRSETMWDALQKLAKDQAVVINEEQRKVESVQPQVSEGNLSKNAGLKKNKTSENLLGLRLESENLSQKELAHLIKEIDDAFVSQKEPEAKFKLLELQLAAIRKKCMFDPSITGENFAKYLKKFNRLTKDFDENIKRYAGEKPKNTKLLMKIYTKLMEKGEEKLLIEEKFSAYLQQQNNKVPRSLFFGKRPAERADPSSPLFKKPRL